LKKILVLLFIINTFLFGNLSSWMSVSDWMKSFLGKNGKGTFDARDTFRDTNDRNISTKIVNKEFNLTLMALDDNGDETDFSGTVCSRVESTNGYKGDYNKTIWNNEKEKNASFNIDRAIGGDNNATLYIKWFSNDSNANCTDSPTGETNSTDNFAIRPDRFKVYRVTIPIYAGEDFNISYSAKVYGSDNNATDYNESNGTSFNIHIKEINSSCKTGNFTGDVDFSDGNVTVVSNYDEVGEIDINITDRDIACDKRFAGVDCKDQNVSGDWNSDVDTSIDENDTIFTILPYEINITNVSFSDNSWIYMDTNLSEKSMELNLTLKAFNKGGNLLEDFNSTCYAKDINVSFNVINNHIDEFNGTYAMNKGKSTYSNDTNFSDTNFSALDYNFTILKDDFSGGEGNLSFLFNVERNYSKAIKAFDINFTESNITTDNLAKYENNKSLDKNISFYYAKLYTQDMHLIGDTNDSELLPVLVYDNGSHFSEEKLVDWYVQTNNDENFSKILGTANNYVFDSDKNVSNFKADIDLKNSEFNLSIDNNSSDNKFVVVHLKTPEYVWYSKYKDYNDSNKSTCLTHYCVAVSLENNSNNGNLIAGGTTKGTEANTTDGNHTFSGVKIFR